MNLRNRDEKPITKLYAGADASIRPSSPSPIADSRKSLGLFHGKKFAHDYLRNRWVSLKGLDRSVPNSSGRCRQLGVSAMGIWHSACHSSYDWAHGLQQSFLARATCRLPVGGALNPSPKKR